LTEIDTLVTDAPASDPTVAEAARLGIEIITASVALDVTRRQG
jgi:hypothetical protein